MADERNPDGLTVDGLIGHVFYDKPAPIESPPDSLQYAIEEALRKVPFGLNRFSEFTLRCMVEHGEKPRWTAVAEWASDGEERKVWKGGLTADEAVQRVSEALDG